MPQPHTEISTLKSQPFLSRMPKGWYWSLWSTERCPDTCAPWPQPPLALCSHHAPLRLWLLAVQTTTLILLSSPSPPRPVYCRINNPHLKYTYDMYYFHIFSNWYTEWAKHSGTFNYSSIYALKYALMDLPSQLLDKPLGKPHSPSVPFRLKKKKPISIQEHILLLGLTLLFCSGFPNVGGRQEGDRGNRQSYDLILLQTSFRTLGPIKYPNAGSASTWELSWTTSSSHSWPL